MFFGSSIAFSEDTISNCNNFAIGGPDDNSGQGAIWIYGRNGSIFSWDFDNPTKLVPAGAIGNSIQFGTLIKFGGNKLIIGGSGDNYNTGAIWRYNDIQPTTTTTTSTTTAKPSTAPHSSSSMVNAAKWALSFFGDNKQQ